MIISLDIETYGAFKSFDVSGKPCPDQTAFHPVLSRRYDMGTCLPCRLVPQCAITVVNGQPHQPETWTPGSTAVFDTVKDIDALVSMISRTEVIVGSNIAFDIMYLREFSALAPFLNISFRIMLVDTIILSWIHSGARKERSLKALGPALGAFTYERTLKDGKFPFPMSAAAVKYNAEDTHNAVLAASALASRITEEHGKPISEECLRFHSDRLWNIIDLSTNGQRFLVSDLQELLRTTTATADADDAVLAANGIISSGECSGTTQAQLISTAVECAERFMPDLLDSKLLEYTDKKRTIRNNVDNRRILKSIIAQSDAFNPTWDMLGILNAVSEKRSLAASIESILAPSIFKGNTLATVPSNCVTQGDYRLCFPSWYGAPTDEGGVQSARLSCRRPAAQTWQSALRSLMVGPPGSTVHHVDMRAFELRIAAALSRDADMHAFAFSEDPYSMSAPGRWSEDRDALKIALLVGVNGGSPDKAWRTAVAKTGRMISKRDVLSLPVWQWSQFKKWSAECYERGRDNQLSLDIAGIRYMHNPAKTMHDTNSFMIQGHAAVFMSIVQSRMLLFNYRCALQMHDELSIEVPNDMVADMRLSFGRCVLMASTILFGERLPFTSRMSSKYDSDSETGVHNPG